MDTTGSWRLGEAQWLWPGIFIGLILLALWGRFSWKAGLRGAWLALALLTRSVGLGLVVFCLVDPGVERGRAKPGANQVVILADNSASLAVSGPSGSSARSNSLDRVLRGPDQAWMARLAETFKVHRYQFDSRLLGVQDFSRLDFSGPSSQLGRALTEVSARFKGQPLAAILLLTDGQSTDEIPADGPGLPPIFPVVPDATETLQDLSLRRAVLQTSPFEEAPWSVDTEVAVLGMKGVPALIRVRPLNAGTPGVPVAEKEFVATENESVIPLRLSWQWPAPGVQVFQIEVRRKDEASQPTLAGHTVEVTLQNNHREVLGERDHGPHRILYVGGRPNWEFKFLNRALSTEELIHIVGLIRIARREPKFDFIGRDGESANPLFRGFDGGAANAAERERYDQPVLTRINTIDEVELRAGFPADPATLFRYDAMVVGDVEADFFTRDQLQLIRRFVADRGAGFLMLGGAESFAEGGYAATVLSEVLPVRLDRSEVALPDRVVQAGVSLELTQEGWLEPWMRLRTTETEQRERERARPKLRTWNAVNGVKPGASVLWTLNDAQNRRWPGLVVQRFGLGRSAALLAGDLWRWGLHDEASHADLDRFWRQLARWLVVEAPRRVTATVAPASGDSGNLKIRVHVLDPVHQPDDQARVSVEVRMLQTSAGPAAQPESLILEPGSEAGTYEGWWTPRQPGPYRLLARALDSKGSDIGSADAGWVHEPMAEELKDLRINRLGMERLARATGGRMVRTSDLNEWVRQLPSLRAPIQEVHRSSAWNQPRVLAALLGCLILDWALRRWRGLP